MDGAVTTTCSAELPWGTAEEPTTVVLTATPDVAGGYAYYAFAGACSGSGVCSVTGNADKLVLVRFAKSPQGLPGHPNFSDPTVHGQAYRAFEDNVPDAWQCTQCHGASLQGQGLAISCASCHAWPRDDEE